MITDIPRLKTKHNRFIYLKSNTLAPVLTRSQILFTCTTDQPSSSFDLPYEIYELCKESLEIMNEVHMRHSCIVYNDNIVITTVHATHFALKI